MAGMIVMKVVCIMVVFMVVAMPYTEALSCNDVRMKLAPCLKYLQSGGMVSRACCNGVKGLDNLARTIPDRKTACNCMKAAYKTYSTIKPDNAAGLPNKCGVRIPYKMSPDTDCNKVK
ncbi:non-specific lipid-transfer protein Lac s 1-like [Rutidosis leptorrhynchoides]|uniref:non-specific lipid-transfer protein Lac s 1-like n=1 Tax=Rutidosis leptorrhynchoides TaxID=125765 RepID=UPI003A98FF7F